MAPPATDTARLPGDVRVCPDCGRRFTGDAAFCPFDGVRLVGGEGPASRDPLVGSTVDGRYQVLAVLGEGGMGRVYRVRHAALDRPFAMKVLRPELASHDDLGTRFLHEARATAAVKHPNVVEITDFGRLPDGVPYFVMELLPGRTLTELLRGRPLPDAAVVPIVRQLASALGAAHAAGVVHRDLKPDNVFLLGEAGGGEPAGGATPSPRSQVWPLVPEVRVVDFGAALILGEGRITRAGVVFGTPHYMSPEQVRGDAVDRRTDVYGLGVMLYEMLTGRVPFESDTYLGVLTQHMFSPVRRPSEVYPGAGASPRLEAIALRCLAKAPDERFASMDEVLAALEGADAGGPGVGDDGDASPAALRPSSAHLAASTRVLAWTSAAVVGFGVTLAVAGFVGRRSPEDRPAAHLPAPPLEVPAAAEVVPIDRGTPSPGLPQPPTGLPPPPSAAISAPSAAIYLHRPPPRPAAAPPPNAFDDVGDPFTRSR
jgi:serine/threonine-protein kinase